MHEKQSTLPDDTSIIVYVVRKLGTVRGKKALQKIVYFLESAGIPLSYMFRWWFYGPFSRELDIDIDYLIAEDIFVYQTAPNKVAKLSVKEKDFDTYPLDEKYRNKIDNVLNELRRITNDFNPMDLELAASIHFILTNVNSITSRDEDTVVRIIQKTKKGKFAESKIREMYRLIKESHLIEGVN
ncbi:MAG: hypothetical protein ACP6IS_11580 [Candidatus Asgardarchaeia archaeon]